VGKKKERSEAKTRWGRVVRMGGSIRPNLRGEVRTPLVEEMSGRSHTKAWKGNGGEKKTQPRQARMNGIPVLKGGGAAAGLTKYRVEGEEGVGGGHLHKSLSEARGGSLRGWGFPKEVCSANADLGGGHGKWASEIPTTKVGLEEGDGFRKKGKTWGGVV